MSTSTRAARWSSGSVARAASTAARRSWSTARSAGSTTPRRRRASPAAAGAALVEVVGQRVGAADLATPEPVEAGVDHDPVQPGGHGGVAAVGVGAAERGDQRVLQRVGGLLGVAGGAQRDRPQPVAVPGEQHPEGVGVAVDVRAEQGPVVGRGRRRGS